MPATAQTPPAEPAPMVSTQPAAPVGPVRRLSIDEAVTMALEQNVSLQVQKMNPDISSLDVAQAYGAASPLIHLTGAVPLNADKECFHGVDDPEFIELTTER